MTWSGAIKIVAIGAGASIGAGVILYAVGVRNPGVVAIAAIAAQVGAVKLWG